MRQGNELEKLTGGIGCDIVTSANGGFVPRRGKIFAFIVREANTNIEHIKEYNDGVITTVTSRSWIGGESTGGFVDLLAGEYIVPDYPITEITLTAGSIVVYYDEYGWKHNR
jgi:hypothetical protein